LHLITLIITHQTLRAPKPHWPQPIGARSDDRLIKSRGDPQKRLITHLLQTYPRAPRSSSRTPSAPKRSATADPPAGRHRWLERFTPGADQPHPASNRTIGYIPSSRWPTPRMCSNALICERV